jgi:type II secretory pathway component PulC
VKWLAAAAGVLAAGGISLLLFGARDEPATPAARQPAPAIASAAPAPRVAVPPPASRIEPPPGVTLQGVLLRGAQGAQSQALLTVDGRQQSYAIGDSVKAGWTVQAIREQQVVLANGSASTAIGVAAPTPDAAAPEQRGATTPVAAAAAPRLPGFVPSAAAPLSDAGASERNRRFLDAVQAKERTRQ